MLAGASLSARRCNTAMEPPEGALKSETLRKTSAAAVLFCLPRSPQTVAVLSFFLKLYKDLFNTHIISISTIRSFKIILKTPNCKSEFKQHVNALFKC